MTANIATITARYSAAPPPAWPHRLGIINDYLRIPYANGSSFASQLLYREFSRRGHEVVVIGPNDPLARPEQLPKRYVELSSLPLKNHPGVQLALPSRTALAKLAEQRFDLVLGQTGSAMMDLGVWLRKKHQVPLVCVNTIHLPSVYNVLLPDRLFENKTVKRAFTSAVIPAVEQYSVGVYNMSDGLIVLSRGLKEYWRKRGVTAPIHVIPRSVEPKIFDVPSRCDPFPVEAKRGFRLLCVCRHTREKSVDRLLHVFARLIGPAAPEATLTLVGDGPDHQSFRKLARELGIAEKIRFVGEQQLTDIPDYYRHADLFVYASLSETYGQVVSEALWCGLPAVAFADGMGVSEQIEPGHTGYLIEPGPQAEEANWRFANAVLGLLREPARRKQMAQRAALRTRELRHPDAGIAAYYEAFQVARHHVRATEPRFSSLGEPLTLAAWWALHMTLYAGGCVRAPAAIDILGRQPVWDDAELCDETSADMDEREDLSAMMPSAS